MNQQHLSPGDPLACGGKERRLALFGNASWNGIDFLEVGCDQLSLCVHFFGQVPAHLTPANIRIEGGRRVQGIGVVAVHVDPSDDPERDDCLHIDLDKFGDFSVYRLCLVNAAPEAGPLAGFDPRYACLDFSFKIDCPSDFDCRSEPVCVEAPPPAPEISYLAKDYQSFRQLLLDRLALTLPEWRERHVPDIGITLVEVLAYTADMLSYYQDAVATEAYLETARRRISVRRHVRLLDYRLHEGCNARAWLALTCDSVVAKLPADVYFATGSAGMARINGSRTVSAVEAQRLAPGDHLSYQPVLAPGAAQIDLYGAHNAIRFHTWGDTECCLAQGATRATLIDEAGYGQEVTRALKLKKGDVLIFQEVLGPLTGLAADRDLTHRHAVRLTSVVEAVDGLLNQLVLEVTWSPEDALPFTLCLSARMAAPDCGMIHDISIACGNVILVEHGMPVTQDCGAAEQGAHTGDCACEDAIVDAVQRAERLRVSLRESPLTHSVPVSDCSPAGAALLQDPRQAMPRVWLHGEDENGAAQRWEARHDLLASAWSDRHLVAEINDEGVAQLRFGDGELGAAPAAGVRLRASYRIGNGPAGNVGAETISYIVYRSKPDDGVAFTARNPLPALGGTAPETLMEAKLTAPDAFRQVLARAITAEDYATLAQRDVRIERADARLRWNGSWYEAVVSVDPYGRSGADAGLLRAIAYRLYRYRRIGHDLSVRAARYVALEVAFEICVQPHYLRGHVAAALTDAFSNRRLPDGSLGFFHPDRLTFGGAIYASALIGVAQAIEGVQSVCLTALHRFGEAPDGELEAGLLRMASGQIAQLDNDADFPENGNLSFLLRGGR